MCVTYTCPNAYYVVYVKSPFYNKNVVSGVYMGRVGGNGVAGGAQCVVTEEF